MARNASRPFLLWARAAHSQDWTIVLDAPLTLDSYIALLMLQEVPTFEAKMLKLQVSLSERR